MVKNNINRNRLSELSAISGLFICIDTLILIVNGVFELPQFFKYWYHQFFLITLYPFLLLILFAIISGIIALGQITESKESGKLFALFGIAVGVMYFVVGFISLLIVTFFWPELRGPF